MSAAIGGSFPPCTQARCKQNARVAHYTDCYTLLLQPNVVSPNVSSAELVACVVYDPVNKIPISARSKTHTTAL